MNLFYYLKDYNFFNISIVVLLILLIVVLLIIISNSIWESTHVLAQNNNFSISK